MHMQNELLSPGVAVGTIAIAAGAVGFICHRAKSLINSDRFALMGIMGA
ncbi:MAG: cobalamin biosynthesis protein CbiM, partial [Planctomycetota bacterium]